MRSAALACLLVLTGCVAGQREITPAIWVERNAALATLEGWSLSGRIGVKLDDEGFSGALRWVQDGESLLVDVRGPLGAGAFRLSGDPGALLLETGDGERLLYDDPETALTAELGWGVPLQALRYWVIGLAYPGTRPQRRFAADGRLESIEQLGWSVEYERYALTDGWELPRRLRLHNGAGLQVKLVVRDWTLRFPGEAGAADRTAGATKPF